MQYGQKQESEGVEKQEREGVEKQDTIGLRRSTRVRKEPERYAVTISH